MDIKHYNKVSYILVHGAWHGSWCWKYLAQHIKDLGHEVLTPDLPGHYNNPLDFKEVTLDKYVNHIIKLIENSDKKIVLVGHSMAGIVISQVVEKIPDKIKSLVYISAFIPDNEGSLIDQEKLAKVPSASLATTIHEEEFSISLDRNQIPELFFNRCSAEDISYGLRHIQKQPLMPFMNKVSIAKNFSNAQKLYIECLQDNAIHIQDQRRMYSKIACEVAKLDTDHSPFFSKPYELASLILAA